VPGVWEQAISLGIPPAEDDTTALQGVGVIIFDFPSQNGTTTSPVIEKIELIDAWAIKTDAEGAGDDRISVIFRRPTIPEITALFNLAPSPVGGKIYLGADSPDNPGANWGRTDLVLEPGDTLRFDQFLNTNNACRVYFLAVRRT
jgi:hypothetical protein